MKYVSLATEDEVSEAVGRRLISDFLPDFTINVLFRKGGFGHLKSRINTFCKMATREPLILITDLDNTACAPSLKSSWLEGINPPDNLLFRVAVHEIEAWLLADTIAIKALFGKTVQAPRAPDTVPEPKELLLKLAKKAPRRIKEDLLIERGAIASQGIGYNRRLCEYVWNSWNPILASQQSDSLHRTINALKKLSLRFHADV
ncbi:MAG: DUF4276 family protein [Alphaproteobacteria bacterium]|nr:DUF4276 family protein [Alphaproteobacteria bacterium]